MIHRFFKTDAPWLRRATVYIREFIKVPPTRVISILCRNCLLTRLRTVLTAICSLSRATTVLVLTLGSGVDGFTLDPDTGRFLHTHKDIRIPSAGPIYSFNEANFHDYEAPVRRYLNALKEGSSSVGIRLVAVVRVWIGTFHIIAYWCASLVWFFLATDF
jgi:hypothetical protein